MAHREHTPGPAHNGRDPTDGNVLLIGRLMGTLIHLNINHGALQEQKIHFFIYWSSRHD